MANLVFIVVLLLGTLIDYKMGPLDHKMGNSEHATEDSLDGGGVKCQKKADVL